VDVIFSEGAITIEWPSEFDNSRHIGFMFQTTPDVAGAANIQPLALANYEEILLLSRIHTLVIVTL